ncbi:MAG TPA: pyridoxamine 5'-phosphate oxidase family protein [Anaerolineales bacterium]|nr:pyridoxamine 5'-phosphate oxidase family protein [Anaerolineales bacterium]
MASIPEKAQYLLQWETKAFAFMALSLKDGSPQVTPVWFDWDGEHVIINTARGRVKDKVLKRRGKVALTIPDPVDTYKYMQIRGSVVAETEEGGYEMICKLNDKYHGKYEYPKIPGQVRVTYKIAPEKVFTNIK